MDGNGLKLEKIGQFFQALMLRVSKNPQEIHYGQPSLITFICYLRCSFTETFCLRLTPQSDILAQN